MQKALKQLNGERRRFSGVFVSMKKGIEEEEKKQVKLVQDWNIMHSVGVNYSPPKGLELLPTIPKDLLAQHIPEQERDVVGSALWKPVYQGQPVSSKNDVKTNIDIAIARGTIHLNPEGVEFSLPLDPDDIIENKTCHFCGGNAVMTPVTKKVYTCTKCGAEGETLVSVKKEAKP